jgi:methionyl-tRNA formyltransferase
MRVLLVTSSITFVPENYNRLICRLVEHPSVVGLLEINNRKPEILAKACALALTLSAPRMGLTLIQNYLGNSSEKRRSTYLDQNKFYKKIENINSNEALDIIRNENIDLIINARTRSIYKSAVLNAPRLGCLNIHHGLLPEQRGLMCDFWAHLENTDFGFSIHQMTEKIDDGPIVHVEKVLTNKTSYLDSILKASEIEADVCFKLIDKIQDENKISPLILDTKNFKYRKNPKLRDGYKLQLKGVRV